MSLINQMLKDLEQRNAPPSAKIPPVKHSTSLWVALILTCFVLLAGAAYWWTQLPQRPVVESPSSKLVKLTPTTTLPMMAPSVEVMPAEPLPEAPEPPALPSISIPAPAADEAINDALTLPPPQRTATVKTAARTTVNSTPIAAMEALVTPPSSKPLFSKLISADQISANLYRQALSFLQQGRVAEAQAVIVESLEAKPANHDARLTLASLLVDNHRYSEASITLKAGLDIAPERTDFRMAMARLQIEAGDRAGAFKTLEQGLSYAKNDADYLGFFATMLQAAARHEEAANYYLAAITVNTAAESTINTNTLLGLGISLQATGKLRNAQEAFIRAQADRTLSPELGVFVAQRLKEIKQALNQ